MVGVNHPSGVWFWSAVSILRDLKDRFLLCMDEHNRPGFCLCSLRDAEGDDTE